MHRLGIIGAGDVVRRSYLPALTARTDCEVRAICSRSGSSAAALAPLFGDARVYNTYTDLLAAADVDTVVIATPPDMHREMAERAMASGKHVLVEKPLCPSFADTRAVLERAAAYGRTFYVAFNNQFREENVWLAEQVRAGVVGRVHLIDFEWFRTRRHVAKTWLYDAAVCGGGVLMDLGVHLVHLALGMLPNRRRYRATCTQLRTEPAHSGEDTAVATIVVDDEPVIVLKTGWDMKLATPSKVTLTVYGDRAAASNRDFTGPKSDGFALLLEDFLAHVASGARADLARVHDTMALTDALYAAAATGRPIDGCFRSLA